MTSAAYMNDPYVASNPENLPFWQAAEEERLLGKQCAGCGKFHWYPRVVCPFCRSEQTAWLSMSGRGTVYACSTLRRADPPYIVAYVQLDEGPIMLTNLVGTTEMPPIGSPVRVVFERTEDGRNAPKFTTNFHHE